MKTLVIAAALTWVSNVAWAESKPIQIRSFSVEDISQAVENVADMAQAQPLSADFKSSPVRKVKILKTEPWMNYVQMNDNSLFLSVKF